MICELCGKKESAIFLEAIRNGKRRKINLCADCACARGIAIPVPEPDPKNLESVFQEIEEKERKNDADAFRLCPVCARSLRDIKKTGNTGCPECYEIFKTEIMQSLSEKGLLSKYTGSMPKRLVSFRNALTDRADLQAKLEQAVKQENYEKAAVYRDFLKALEHGSVQDGNEVTGENADV